MMASGVFNKKSKNIYDFKPHELVIYAMIFDAIIVAMSILYFRSLIAVLFLMPLLILFFKDAKKSVERKRRNEILGQFRALIQSINASLKNSSKTLQNCFDDAVLTMRDIYSSKSSFMKVLNQMYNHLHQDMNNRIDDQFMEMAIRLNNDDIYAFAVALKECYGVNTAGISKVIDKYSNLIDEKRRINEDVQTIIRSQRVEQCIMLCVPAAIIVVFGMTMPSYLECLYGTSVGIIVMSIVCVINVAAYFLGNKISRIG